MRYARDPNDPSAVNIFIDLYKSFYDNRILIPGLSANGILKHGSHSGVYTLKITLFTIYFTALILIRGLTKTA